jgi:hypothetical protein
VLSGCKVDTSGIPDSGFGLFVDIKQGAPKFDITCFLFGKIVSRVELAELNEPACVTKLSDTEFLLSKSGPKNYGFFPQDGMNEQIQNVERVSYLVRDENGDDQEFWPFVGIAPLKPLAFKDELFYQYGKPHWCFKPNFDTLNLKQKNECKKYYDIKPKEIREVHPYATVGATAAKTKARKTKK